MLTPLIFYLKFGSLNWFSIGFTIFLVVLCLLFAMGFFIQNKPELHTPVPMEGSLADRIGALWLVACAFGPFLGWIITAIPLTEASWKWQYLARVFLAVVLPVITAVPLVPYARGKAALIAIPLLLFITALPILSCAWVLADLHDGPETVVSSGTSIVAVGSPNDDIRKRIDEIPCSATRPGFILKRYKVTWLKHTQRALKNEEIKC